jgi:hypothetical protein
MALKMRFLTCRPTAVGNIVEVDVQGDRFPLCAFAEHEGRVSHQQRLGSQ